MEKWSPLTQQIQEAQVELLHPHVFIIIETIQGKKNIDPNHPVQLLLEKKGSVHPLITAQACHLFSTFSTKEIILTYGVS